MFSYKNNFSSLVSTANPSDPKPLDHCDGATCNSYTFGKSGLLWTRLDFFIDYFSRYRWKKTEERCKGQNNTGAAYVKNTIHNSKNGT